MALIAYCFTAYRTTQGGAENDVCPCRAGSGGQDSLFMVFGFRAFGKAP